FLFFFSSRRRHTSCLSDWSSDVCSSDLNARRLAAVLWHSPNVRLSPLIAIAHETNVAIAPPHRPRIHPQKARHVLECVRLEIDNGHIRLIRAPITLPPIRLAFAIDRQLGAVGRE